MKTIQNPTKTSDSIKNKSKRQGVSIAFLGPDGSGKSTIISGLLDKDLPYERHDYFHLKPIPQEKENKNIVEDPHQNPPYGAFKSFIKLGFFLVQYNLGWLKNILPLKRKASLIIFDRYYDDLLVDYKRYRYGGGKKIASLVRYLIFRPELYFILTADPAIIHQRKQEVSFEELERQIKGYRNLVDNKRYISIDVNSSPELIVEEITSFLIEYTNGRS